MSIIIVLLQHSKPHAIENMSIFSACCADKRSKNDRRFGTLHKMRERKLCNGTACSIFSRCLNKPLARRNVFHHSALGHNWSELISPTGCASAAETGAVIEPGRDPV
jgi:hypothetical protein